MSDQLPEPEWADQVRTALILNAGSVISPPLIEQMIREAVEADLKKATGGTESAAAMRASQEVQRYLAPLKLPSFLWVGLPKTGENVVGGTAIAGNNCIAVLECLSHHINRSKTP